MHTAQRKAFPGPLLDRLTARRHAAQRSVQRSAILRGIHEQNRRLHHAGPLGERRSPARRLLPLLVTLPVFAAVLLLAFPSAPPTEAFSSPSTTALTQITGPAVSSGAWPQPATRAAPPATLPEAGRPQVRPNDAADNASELAGLAAVAADMQNLKSLFGLSVRTIVIDAGHGGRDPGALGKLGTREKDINLDVARRLRDKLEASGDHRILMVRDEDVFVPLRQRADFANAQGVDLFVSIHVNYLPNVSTNAVETYYFGHYDNDRTRALAERENQGSDYSLSEFESLVRKMQDTVKLQESRALAHAIQDSLLGSIRAQNQRVLDNGVRTAPFVVLLGVKAPSVLVEVGSLSSPDAERQLRRETYRDEIASYVATGITHYLNAPPAQEHDPHENEIRLSERQ